MRPLVSVIVPNYNHARFLRQRIESVMQQSYPNIEVLLLDDFSSDGSLEIIESYRNHPKVTHVILNDHNQGSPFIQWKKGLDLAKGELTWIAESDDYAEFTFVEQLVNIIGKDKGMGLAFCQSNTVDSAGHELNKTMEWWTHDLDEKVWRSDYIHTGEEEVRSYLIFKNTIPNTSGVVFRTDKGKALIDQILSYRYCGDWLFWALICLHSERIGYSALVLNHFRNSAASTRSLINYRKMSLRVNEIYSVMLILSEQLQVNAYCYYGYYFRIHFNLKDGNLNEKRNKYFWQLLLMDKLLFARMVNHYLIVIVKKIFKKKKKSLPVQMF